jgi:hypothetical protein
MRPRVILVVGFLALVSCGGKSPPGPTTSLNLGGNWSGTWQYVTSGVTIVDSVTATLAQTGADASGTWTAESGASGQLQRLVPQPSTSGSVTITQTTVTGTACTATAAVAGTASATTIELTVSPIAPSGVCQWAASQRFSLRRE